MNLTQWGVLIILCVQNTTIMLSMKYVLSRSAENNDFTHSTTVVCVEFTKLVASVLVFLATASHKTKSDALSHLKTELVSNWRSGVALAVPAFIYCFQNNVMFVALSNLDAAVAQVMYQLKILTTALLSRVLLNRRLSPLKWFSLACLTAGVAMVKVFGTYPASAPQSSMAKVENIVQASSSIDSSSSCDLANSTLSECGAGVFPSASASSLLDPTGEKSQLLGVAAVLVACTTSALAGVFFEKVLKGSNVGLWVRNIQLAMYGVLFALVMTFVRDGAQILERGFFHGYSPWVWAIVAEGAVGGLIVALVVQHADSILKCFAVSASIVLSSLLSMYFQDFEPSAGFVSGTTLVVMASLLYCRPESTKAKAS